MLLIVNGWSTLLGRITRLICPISRPSALRTNLGICILCIIWTADIPTCQGVQDQSRSIRFLCRSTKNYKVNSITVTWFWGRLAVTSGRIVLAIASVGRMCGQPFFYMAFTCCANTLYTITAYSVSGNAALHGMQTRSSDENSVWPSVCHTRELWQNGRKICPDLYTIWKNI